MHFPLIISPNWLKENLKNVKIVDASYPLPKSPKTDYENFLKSRIPGAVFFDIDKIADQKTSLPHMLPTEKEFADIVGRKLGITEKDHVVIYDAHGLYSAPRVWYTFHMFGNKNVGILDGGFPLWKRLKFEVESGATSAPPPALFQTYFQKNGVVDIASILKNITSKQSMVLDARSNGRFHGTEPEPRAGLKGGHIPNSINMPFGDLLFTNPITNTVHLKPVNELQHIFEERGIPVTELMSQDTKESASLIASCGSGLTACIVLFALRVIGVPLHKLKLYDGSWTEYGGRNDTPIAV